MTVPDYVLRLPGPIESLPSPLPPSKSMDCKHETLIFELSSHASESEYQRPDPTKRASASSTSTARKNGPVRTDVPSSTFPAPLVLPDDALDIDPRCPPQSLRSWLRLKDRNEVTSDKNVIYVAGPPEIGSDVDLMRSWSIPQTNDRGSDVPPPSLDDVVDYLAAFYHGLPVKVLPPPKLSFANWDSTPSTKRAKGKTTKPSKASIPSFIGLNTHTECVRIRTRPSLDGKFAAQLNLDDLLDAAISILPEDAYALLLLVNQDLYEDDDDDFVCGRAYGGSRVAVISTARYNPTLDQQANVERVHAWPASHCALYVEETCRTTNASLPPKKKTKVSRQYDHDQAALSSTPTDIRSPMQQAINAYQSLPLITASSSAKTLTSLWLSRVCRTASHELGHCFGMEHCVYYACVMQSTASLAEDARQPPYLCPVDLAKMLHATGSTAEARYRTLLAFCNRHLDVQMFAAFAGWIGAVLGEE
ncbi:hypothetical protein CVT26_007316 [Gymnopilus dilepis]|uniref:Uncharacterized protein n=1 Tax=Gymnopilus dilepis TaxID=231916 RepID=A0A409W1K8_9AGAR|nr:hypothetical protein CVT26_007316 [Gymnopilus dilepis]